VFVLLSHRWLRPSENFPDTADNQKARTASELAKWIKWFLARPEVNSFSHHPSESCVEVFFWVDWACMDQTPGATAPYIYSLPLYTGACWLFANVESADYDQRAWCLVERAMAYAFMRAGVTPLAVPLGFTHQRQAFSKVPLPLLRPESANLTFESDRPAICLLSAAAQRSNSFAWWRFARYYCCDVLGTQWSSRLKLWFCSCGVFCCGICCLLPWYYSRRLSFDGDDASMITVHRLTDEPPVQTNPPTAVTTMRKQQ